MLPNNTCGRCKNPIQIENAKFCTTCGYKLTTPTSSPPVAYDKPPSFEQQTREATGHLFHQQSFVLSLIYFNMPFISYLANIPGLYGKVAPRVIKKYGPTKNPIKPLVNDTGRINSFNKSNLDEKSFSDEGSHHLMNPSNASFISYRNDNKFTTPASSSSSSSLTSYQENLAQYLEVENSMKIEGAYDDMYHKAESKVKASRDITNPSISEVPILSDNYNPPKHTNPTLTNYTATRRYDEKARSVDKKDDYLHHVTPVDELYRNRLIELQEAHKLMPVKDGREHGVPDDDHGPNQSNNGNDSTTLLLYKCLADLIILYSIVNIHCNLTSSFQNIIQ